MRGPIRSALGVALVAVAFAALAVQASAANLKEHGVTEPTGFLAIYGTPAANGVAASTPLGGGLGRNFGFGENMLFEACGGCSPVVGENLAITIPAEPAALTEEAKESFIGGTLMSNKTGTNNPLSFSVQFSDFQHGTLAGYSDTSDRPWIMEVCSPAAAASACKTDAQFSATATKGAVKIEDVSINLGPGTTVQGWVWGVWENGKEKVPPCIKLELPPAASPSLVVTQSGITGVAVGAKISAIKGKACLISANNNWYKAGTEVKEPEIELANE